MPQFDQERFVPATCTHSCFGKRGTLVAVDCKKGLSSCKLTVGYQRNLSIFPCWFQRESITRSLGNICSSALLVLKGIYDCWQHVNFMTAGNMFFLLFLQGPEANGRISNPQMHSPWTLVLQQPCQWVSPAFLRLNPL